MKNIISYTDYDIKKLLPKRNLFSNKGDFGKLLIVAGSKQMCGCCVLATLGALRSGVGIVKLAFPEDLYVPLLSQLKECLFIPLKSNNGHLDKSCEEILIKEAENCDAVVFGCGLGVSSDVRFLCESLILKNKKTLIIDADGLNCLSENTDILNNKSCDIVLTPHPKEFSRLSGLTVDYIENNRQKVIEAFVDEYNVTVLLKGHETLVASKNVSVTYKNNTGNSGLSKGGSGDLLSGIIGALAVTMKGDLFKAAAVGSYLHGKCADISVKDFTEYSMLPSDCADVLPKVFSSVLSESD